MKQKLIKSITKILVLGLCLYTTGCNTTAEAVAVEKAKVKENKGFEIVMWRINPEEEVTSKSGNSILLNAITKFKLDYKIDIQVIEIEANTPEEFLLKRNALLASSNPPEMVLFNTANSDELMQIEQLREHLLPMKEALTDVEDIYPGLYGEFYSTFAFLALSGTINESIGKQYLPQSDGENNIRQWISSADFANAMIAWGKEASLNQNIKMTYAEVEILAKVFSQESLSFTQTDKGYDIALKPVVILKNIRLLADFYRYTADGKNKDFKGLLNTFSGEDQGILTSQYQRYFSELERRFYQNFWLNPPNLLNLEETQKSKVPNWQTTIVGESPYIGAVGFAIVDTESEELVLAKQFAQYLLSPEFQSSFNKIETGRPSLTGSVLRSVNQNQIQAAKDGVVSEYVSGIDEDSIALKEQILALCEADLFLEKYAECRFISDLTKRIQLWAIDYHCGIHTDDAYFLEEIQKLQNEINLKLNE